MGVRYDKSAAEKLVGDMQRYVEEIMSATRNLCNDSMSSDWKDTKYKEYLNVLSSLMGDIKSGACTVRDYKDHLSQKIKELE